MRGKLSLFVNDSDGIRITPAHAGKTSERMPCVRQIADHPRACGENASNAINSAVGFGSPPRMRGKPSHLLFSSRSRRITPAHAGKTGGSVRSCLSISDHPRACGENFFIKRLTFFPGGSPPRMRGKQLSIPPSCVPPRITPAHAGKTLRKCYISEVNPHPILQFPLTSHKVVVSSGNPTKLCVILLYQIESILLKSGVYSPVHPPAFVLQGLTCQL